MARALSGHGPLGTLEWDDDRTVVVVKVCESLAASPDMFTIPVRNEPATAEEQPATV